jgi:hypothetical protein
MRPKELDQCRIGAKVGSAWRGTGDFLHWLSSSQKKARDYARANNKEW